AAAGTRRRFAVLVGDTLGEPLGVAHDQHEGLAQDFGALARLPAGPALEGIARRIDRGLGVLHGRARDRSDLVLGRRVEHVETAAVGGFAPFAANPQIGRHVGEQVVISRAHGCNLITLNSSCAAVDIADAHAGYEFIERRTRSTMRSTVGSAMSSKMSAAGSGMCGVVIRTGGPSRS